LSATIIVLLFILIIATFISIITIVFAEEVITILPSSNDKSRSRFLDITFYPIEKGRELTWFNDDYINHRIIVNSTQDNKTILADSAIIKPKDSFTYTFEEPGTYHFSSPTYAWIKGTVFVTDDIITETDTDSKNDIDVQLSWTPSAPTIGQEIHFKVIFIDKKTNKNQEHIDYTFTLVDPKGNKIALQAPHSGWGVEPASYKFGKEGEYKARIAIFNVLFVPVEVGTTEFDIITAAASTNADM
jgi:lipopolysaccharide export LptBFGC system permease protein LptF